MDGKKKNCTYKPKTIAFPQTHNIYELITDFNSGVDSNFLQIIYTDIAASWISNFDYVMVAEADGAAGNLWLLIDVENNIAGVWGSFSALYLQ
jgi:hypothetical protein